MKYILIVLFFWACGGREAPLQRPHILYTSEWACEQERLAKLDTARKISPIIDSLISKRNRHVVKSDEWKFYEDSVQYWLATLKKVCGPTDREYNEFLMYYYGVKLGFDPAKKIKGLPAPEKLKLPIVK